MMENLNINNIIDQIKQGVKGQAGNKYYIPNIMEFCESDYYLNLVKIHDNHPLYPMQKITLKCFYRGQIGNEHLKLTKEEIELLKENKLDGIIDKYNSNEVFRELILVWGRRSGKDHLTSLIALYEAMKLLELPNGDPFKYYNIDPGNPIYILTVANSSDQAKILFNEIRTKLTSSKYFKDKVSSITADTIWLKTDYDANKQKQLIEAGLAKTAGKINTSVAIRAGHSNSDSLLGKRYMCILLDEVATYKTTGGPMSGDTIYKALGPGTADFKRKIGVKPDGSPLTITDSKIITISSPRSSEGKLFQLYSETPSIPSRLAVKLPTWKVNLSLTEESLRDESKYMTAGEFAMEFGAEFAGTGGEKFIPDHYVDTATEMGMQLGLNSDLTKSHPGVAYYAHLDPATTNHNYALVILHIEERVRNQPEPGTNVMKKEKVKMFIVDHIKVWTPSLDEGISINEVDEYICLMNRLYRLVSVTYDRYESWSSLEKLRSKGIPTQITPFRRQYKVQIYTNLEQLLINKQLALPRKGQYSELLANELKCLRRIPGNQGFSIKPNPEGQVTTDDVADALVGAIGAAMSRTYSGYARSTTVYMPLNQTNQQSWSIGRGQFSESQYKMLQNKLH